MAEKKTALIIDDFPAIGEYFRELLSADGFDVCLCENGMTALDLSKGKCFDVIVTDYRMPGMNGADITKLLRIQCPASFIIGISSDQRGDDFLEAGADVFLIKPVSAGEFISTIRGISTD